ncbi:MAG: hypothetical protein WKG01_09030 [Kofleriaceae bacterium]
MEDHKLASAVADGGRLRALVLELWQRTRMDWGFVSDRLSTTFRKEKWIGSHDRRFVSETLYGLVRHLRRIDAALARGKPGKAPRDLERLLALFVLEKLIETSHAKRLEPSVNWQAVAGIDDVIANERKPATRIALAASLPDWLGERLLAEWGARAEKLALALNQRAPMTIRANVIVGDRSALAEALDQEGLTTRPGQWIDTALIVESRTNLFASAAFKRGAFEAQDEGSQLLAELAIANLETKKPVVIDLCAGAGGKTLAIAARLANRGRIIATDVDRRKLDELVTRARRAKVSNTQALPLESGAWPAALDSLRGKADVVLVDAPCSGIGSLRRNPEARWRLREADLAMFADRQRQILTNAVGLLAPGGRLVYATCTLLKVENEVADTIPGVVPVPLAEVLGDRAAPFELRGDGSFTVTPSEHGTDGFYARILRRV